MDESLQDYRNLLIAAEQKAQADFDKTVLSLSGGALGISFAFVKDIVGPDSIVNPRLLLLSWIAWGFSVTSVLGSFYFSHWALRKTIQQIDNGNIYKQHPGSIYSWITALLNALGGLLFLVGVVLMVVFIYYNV